VLHGTDYYPEQWLHRPEVIGRDIELMVEAGINAVTLGVFAWSELEPEEGRYELDWLDEVITRCGAAGIETVLATPSAARPAWMAQRYPEVLRTLADGRRAAFGGRHNHCPHSPAYREKVAAIDEVLSRRFGDRREVILWHISNEYQGTCYCERCSAAFQRWLRIQHDDDLELLNLRWWSRFWGHRYTDWSQIEAPVTHGEQNLHGQIIDWKRFVSASIADFARVEIAAVRRHDPTTPTTHNFMGLHDSLDYVDLVSEIDVVSGDIYPAWGLPSGSNDGMLHTVPEEGDVFGTYAFVLAWYRGVAGGRPWLLMESTPGTTNWHEVGRLKRPGAHVLSSLGAVAGGAASIQYFQWRQGRGGWEQFHGSVIGHDGEPGRTFDEVQALSKLLAHLEEPPAWAPPWRELPSGPEDQSAVASHSAVAGRSGAAGKSENALRSSPDGPGTIAPKAAIVFDTPSRWMINQASGPRNDGRRGEVETARRHFLAMHAAGFEVDVVPSVVLLEQEDRGDYQLIVLPMTAHIPPRLAAFLETFVHRGGTLLVTYFSGVFDRWQRLEEGGYPAGVGRLCGVRVTEWDQLAADEVMPITWVSDSNRSAKAARRTGPLVDLAPDSTAREYCEIIDCEPDVEVVGRYGGEFYAGTPAVTRRSVREGASWYVACRIDDMALRKIYRDIAARPDAPPLFRDLAAALPAGMHWMTRIMAEGNLWLFLFNPTDREFTVELPQSLADTLCGAPVQHRVDRVAVSDRRHLVFQSWGSWASRIAPNHHAGTDTP
jgi:beta-galactosidase